MAYLNCQNYIECFDASYIDKDKVYQERLGFQQCFSKQLDELGKTLQLSRKESDAYGHLEDAYDAEVEVSVHINMSLHKRVIVPSCDVSKLKITK